MRGISMPIEMIVIIAIAVLVMVVIVVFFIGSTGSQMSLISDQTALANGCVSLLTRGCNTPLADIKISGYNTTCGGLSGNTLQVACCKNNYREYTYDNPDSCQQIGCGCQAP